MTILQFPSSRAFAVRIERERDGQGWLVRTHDCENSWLHGDFGGALRDARDVAATFGAIVISSAGRAP
jgi:hypothetical protein